MKRRVAMRLGEVGLQTNDVIKMAEFYRFLLEIDHMDNDEVHQTIISEETMLTIYNDGTVKNNSNQNICIAFTVDDVDREYDRLVEAGVTIFDPPQTRPWGARNMSILDPDGNRIYLRSFPKG